MNTVSEEQVLFNKLNYDDQVLIINIMKTLQPEEKEILEKLDEHGATSGDYICQWSMTEKILKDKINEIIDYLKSKGE